MTVTLSKEEARVYELFELRNRLLSSISQLGASISSSNQAAILKQCCTILTSQKDYCLVWAGQRDEEGKTINPLAAETSTSISEGECFKLIDQVHFEINDKNPAALALTKEEPVVIQDINKEPESGSLHSIAKKTGVRSCSSWPIIHNENEYGVLTIYSQKADYFTVPEINFLANLMADISLAIYSQETKKRLLIERDFNQEIVDTVQALLVSIAPCGTIVSFNKKAEETTGYLSNEVIDKYWVDILLAPEERKQNQQQLTSILKRKQSEDIDRSVVNFQASLLTKQNDKKIIRWHGSIRQDIEDSKVGLVLFGIDVTKEIETDKKLSSAIKKWENIFTAMQDPALIVSSDSVILDANSATFTAARKSADEVIGQKVCKILHGGRPKEATCPLEIQIGTGKSRILETELRGLNGNYLLTISPLFKSRSNEDRILLLARDLSDEEMKRAESMRAAQLASIGELAAGVAHEINNPINGIINYARIIMDAPDDNETVNYLQHIVHEGKRIAGIVSNLLDFARRREESPEPIAIKKLLDSCLELISHQLKQDGIIWQFDIPENLPRVNCNHQQIQQVLLNIISNARYSLNKRYPIQDRNKLIKIWCNRTYHEDKPYISITITDYGTGIEHDIMDRLFDPFFSTKPKGEGTGLGLSISHGLVRDNNGFLFVNSEFGQFTSLIVDLPVAKKMGGSNV